MDVAEVRDERGRQPEHRSRQHMIFSCSQSKFPTTTAITSYPCAAPTSKLGRDNTVHGADLRLGANCIGSRRLRSLAGIPCLYNPPGQISQVSPNGPAVRQQIAQRIQVMGERKIDSLEYQGRPQRPCRRQVDRARLRLRLRPAHSQPPRPTRGWRAVAVITVSVSAVSAYACRGAAVGAARVGRECFQRGRKARRPGRLHPPWPV